MVLHALLSVSENLSQAELSNQGLWGLQVFLRNFLSVSERLSEAKLTCQGLWELQVVLHAFGNICSSMDQGCGRRRAAGPVRVYIAGTFNLGTIWCMRASAQQPDARPPGCGEEGWHQHGP